MTILLTVLSFVKKYWKTLSVAAVAGLLIAGFSVLWGRLYVAQGEVMKLTAQVELMKTREIAFKKTIETAVDANLKMKMTLEACLHSNDEWERRYDGYRARLEDELTRREEDRSTIEELNGRLDEVVTAGECTPAVDQLIVALGWAGE